MKDLAGTTKKYWSTFDDYSHTKNRYQNGVCFYVRNKERM